MQLNASYAGIWKIAYPIIIGSLAQNLIGFTDLVFLGRVGEVEFGASGLITIYYYALIMIGFGISRGGQILLARRLGQQQHFEVGKLTHNLFYLEMLVATALFLFLLFGSSTVLTLFIQSTDIYQASLAYLDYRSYSIFFSFFGFVLMALYTSIGRTKIIAIVTISLFLSNIALNYTLIFGKFGLPAMGIAGAGLASTIAEVLSTVIGIFFIVRDKKLKKYYLHQFHRVDWHYIKQIVHISNPLVLQYVLSLGGWFIIFSLIESMGERALAVSTVLKYIYTLYGIPAWGFASAVNSLVSNLIGQGNYEETIQAIFRTAMLSFLSTSALCLTLVLFPYTIVAVFTDDVNVILETQPILFMILAIILTNCVGVIIFNSVMGTGATQYSLLSQIIATTVYLAYAVLVTTVLQLTLSHVWASEFIYWTILGFLSWWFLQNGKWQQYKL